MKPSEIVTMARNTSGTSTSIISDIEAYTYLNIVLEDFWKDICDNNPGYGSNTWYANLVNGTGTYTLQQPVANTSLVTSTFGCLFVQRGYVKNKSTDTYYKKMDSIYLESFLKSPDYYTANQDKDRPLFISDTTTITIYPTPAESITNGLCYIGPKRHFPLGTTGSTVVTEDVEGCILIPSAYHYVIVEGLIEWFYRKRGPDFIQYRQEAQANYRMEKTKTINQLVDRMQLSTENPQLSISSTYAVSVTDPNQTIR